MTETETAIETTSLDYTGTDVTCVNQWSDGTGCSWPQYQQQLDLMNTTWQETSITETNINGTVGMWGKKATEDGANDEYYFYMQFQPDNDDAWWEGSV